MTKRLYSIDAPDQPRLKISRTEIDGRRWPKDARAAAEGRYA